MFLYGIRLFPCHVYDDILTSWSNIDRRILFLRAIWRDCMAPSEVLLLRNPQYIHSVTTSFVYIQSVIQRRSIFNSLFCNKRADWKHCLNIFSSIQLTHYDTWPQDTVRTQKYWNEQEGYSIRQRKRNGIRNRSFATRLYLDCKSKTKEQRTLY